jgi:hypothetical protein
MKRLAVLWLALPSPALAAWPEDVDLESMPVHDGLPVLDRELLGNSYRQLVMELGTIVSNKPITPAETLGLNGFDIDLSTTFALTEAIDRKGEPSPWSRAHRDEQSAPYHTVPTFSVRKGLPLSTEIGGHMGWIGGSSTGLFGGWARLAVLEGYKPAPDVMLKIGYAGYVGNDQLDVGVLDLSATVGSTWGLGRLPGVNTGQFSPWLTFTTLRVSANATIDDETENDIGALRYARDAGDDPDAAPPIALPQFGLGMQFTAGTAHLRMAATWAPATIPTITTGFGFTF